ncbi:uncharacterized protein Z520_04775 [Fonsecaea multimorphosa CBS 102226]|uniref:Uncharacterized protein n=1 Tax=Fonsecaea multimorphosa CBS 102226 TaxID=1442371 RepID=A0A0D2K7P8_9EURO|nr:uncharacterized protein Z520_04775 [Fonsecaea multimorphosa CBS 102226]KIX99199.1 hypothetical protein Z520_04775 [Fonsecaea multimorphosa CBS 102226]OAL25896.1 hypothetical protein AYO22_04523 [Fonsecaea multimorphosa]
MSSVPPSKRQKLEHTGSIANPICLSDDETDSEAGDSSSTASEPDSLQELLSFLDHLNRDEHLAKVMEDVRMAKSYHDVVKDELEIYHGNFSMIRQEIAHANELSEMVESDEEDDDDTASRGKAATLQYEIDRALGDRLIARAFHSPEQIQRLLRIPGRICVYASQLSEALGRWTRALEDLCGLWETFIEIHDAMTKPGPSSMPLKIRKFWGDGHLWHDLELIEERVQTAEIQVNELGEAILEEADAYERQH